MSRTGCYRILKDFKLAWSLRVSLSKGNTHNNGKTHNNDGIGCERDHILEIFHEHVLLIITRCPKLMMHVVIEIISLCDFGHRAHQFTAWGALPRHPFHHRTSLSTL